MRKTLLYLTCALFCSVLFIRQAQAQVFVYEETFTQGQTYCPGSTNYDNWGTFRANLLPLPYLYVTISGSLDPVGITCNDPAAVAQIAANLNSGTETSITCNGTIWRIGAACNTGCAIVGDDIELNAANTGSDCSCGGDYTLRPCIGNANWGSIGVGGCNAATQSMRVEFFAPSFDDDAGIIGILNPALPTCGLDSQDVTVKLQNLGNNTLTSCTINWSVNGGTTSTFSYTGSVAPQGGCDTVIITNASFSNGDDLVIWTTAPNGAIDSLAANDTSAITLSTGLAGTYNIPGDYADFTAAAADLEAFGVCDHVIMNVAAGTYTEQVTIGDILGTDTNRTVTFQGATGIPGDVILEFDPSSTFNQNGVLRISDGDFITVKDMTIDNLSNTFSYGRTVVLEGSATNNVFQNCDIDGSPFNTTSVNNCVVYANSAGLHNNTFTDNRILGGSYAIYYRGDFTTHTTRAVFEDNDVENYYYYGIYSYYNDSTTIRGNRFTTDKPYTSLRGIYVLDNDKQLNIESNYITNDSSNAGNYFYAMYVGNSDGSLNNRLKVTNNCVVGGNPNYSGTAYTFYLTNSGLMDVHNNTFTRISTPTSTAGYCHYLLNGGLISELNNSFVTYGSHYARYVNSTYSLIESDNNNFYTNGNNMLFLNGAYNNLATFANETGFDMNSVTTDPMFYDTTFACATCNDTLDGAGTGGLVTMDVDGNIRSTQTPDIGATEFIATANFTLGDDTTVCGTSYLLESGPAQSVLWEINSVPNSNPTVMINASGSQPEDFIVDIDVQTACGQADDQLIVTLVPGAALDSAQHICADQTATLDPGGGGTADYMWSTGDSTSTIDVDSPGIYNVTKMEMGCESFASIVVTKSEAVDILDIEPCVDAVPVTIDATITNGVSYAWSGGSSTGTAQNTFNQSDIYSVTATDAEGCVSEDTFSIYILEDPIAAITYVANGGFGYFFNSQSSQFISSNTTYSWVFDGNQTSSQANPYFLFPYSTTSQTYTVSLEIDNGCETDLVEIDVVVDPLGIASVANSKGFKLFPNPANSVLNITAEEAWSELTIEIMDVTGRVMSREQLNASQDLISIGVDHLSAGNYIVRLNADDEVSTFSVIVE